MMNPTHSNRIEINESIQFAKKRTLAYGMSTILAYKIIKEKKKNEESMSLRVYQLIAIHGMCVNDFCTQ